MDLTSATEHFQIIESQDRHWWAGELRPAGYEYTIFAVSQDRVMLTDALQKILDLSRLPDTELSDEDYDDRVALIALEAAEKGVYWLTPEVHIAVRTWNINVTRLSDGRL
jgi:hypothetical protein